MPRPKFGLLLPPAEVDSLGAIEELGYDSVWAGDHIAAPFPTLEVSTVVATYAARTSKLRVGGVMIFPLRHPALVAKQFASLDVLSRGRVLLCVGVGGEFPKDYEAVQVSPRERGRRADEGLRALLALWEGPAASFEGRYFQFKKVALNPAPVTKPHPPLWVAGRSEAAQRRAALYGDGYLPQLFTPRRCREARQRIEETAGAAGRDLSRFQMGLFLSVSMAATQEEAHRSAASVLMPFYGLPSEEMVDKVAAVGTPADCAARIAEYADAGVRYFVLTLLGSGTAEQAQRFAQEVRPLVPMVT